MKLFGKRKVDEATKIFRRLVESSYDKSSKKQSNVLSIFQGYMLVKPSSGGIWGNSDKRCVRIYVNEKDALFDRDGLPIEEGTGWIVIAVDARTYVKRS